MKPRVLIVDDSALIRQILTEILSKEGQLEVVGAAADPCQAQEKILRLKPDVITLDVEMPRMDGLTFLEKLMRAHPMPVVMVSSLTERGCETTLRALELGAVDFVTKPKLDIATGVLDQAQEIVAKVKAAAGARVRARRVASEGKAQAVPAAPPVRTLRTTHSIVAIGASTGGTEALREVLCAFPPDAPGTVVVQHMPEKFTASFAGRLDSLARIEVREARDNDRVQPGLALIAPGGRHMQLVRSGAEYRVRVFAGDPVNHHCPSVDVLFHSCAKNAEPNAAGVILTGMGNDGAHGLLAMREAGARTFAQDEATCVVFGMPKEAIGLGAAEKVLPLERVAAAVT
jgi:two-component system, chemotaxis family, protein-glutamate methylesterase/glutaminase